jgi:hypothetical protein
MFSPLRSKHIQTPFAPIVHPKLILAAAVSPARRGRFPPPSEQLAVNECRRFKVLCLWHDHKIMPIERCGQFIYARLMPVTLPQLTRREFLKRAALACPFKN